MEDAKEKGISVGVDVGVGVGVIVGVGVRVGNAPGLSDKTDVDSFDVFCIGVAKAASFSSSIASTVASRSGVGALGTGCSLLEHPRRKTERTVIRRDCFSTGSPRENCTK